jgi:hypothetical protein
MKWANVTLVTSPYCYALCLSEKTYLKEMRRLKVKDPEPWLSDQATACCHFRVNDKTATRLCIVCLRPPENKAGRAQVKGVLVHEAVHIWQRCIAVIGEHSPSDEFMAYSIQQISEELFKLYMEQKT